MKAAACCYVLVIRCSLVSTHFLPHSAHLPFEYAHDVQYFASWCSPMVQFLHFHPPSFPLRNWLPAFENSLFFANSAPPCLPPTTDRLPAFQVSGFTDLDNFFSHLVQTMIDSFYFYFYFCLTTNDLALLPSYVVVPGCCLAAWLSEGLDVAMLWCCVLCCVMLCLLTRCMILPVQMVLNNYLKIGLDFENSLPSSYSSSSCSSLRRNILRSRMRRSGRRRWCTRCCYLLLPPKKCLLESYSNLFF